MHRAERYRMIYVNRLQSVRTIPVYPVAARFKVLKSFSVLTVRHPQAHETPEAPLEACQWPSMHADDHLTVGVTEAAVKLRITLFLHRVETPKRVTQSQATNTDDATTNLSWAHPVPGPAAKHGPIPPALLNPSPPEIRFDSDRN